LRKNSLKKKPSIADDVIVIELDSEVPSSSKNSENDQENTNHTTTSID
jgi:hypothetical protein